MIKVNDFTNKDIIKILGEKGIKITNCDIMAGRNFLESRYAKLIENLPPKPLYKYHYDINAIEKWYKFFYEIKNSKLARKMYKKVKYERKI